MNNFRTGGFNNASRTSELKYIDLTPSGIFLTSGFGTLTLLNGIMQGSDAISRIGRKIQMKSLLIRNRVSLATATTGNATLRTMVVYDKQSNGVTASPTDILTSDTLLSAMNLNNRDRFVCLWDHIDSQIGTAGPQGLGWKKFIKFDLPVQFNSGNAGTIGDIQTGALYLLTYASGNLSGTALINNQYTRVRFSDN